MCPTLAVRSHGSIRTRLALQLGSVQLMRRNDFVLRRLIMYSLDSCSELWQDRGLRGFGIFKNTNSSKFKQTRVDRQLT